MIRREPGPSWASGVAIDSLLEGPEPGPADVVEERLVGRLAVVDVGRQHGRDRVDDLLARERRPEDLAERGVVAGRAAEHQLVKLLALLVDAEDPDVADVVLTAGVDAAGDVEGQIAEIVDVVEVVDLLADPHGDRDRPGVG